MYDEQNTGVQTSQLLMSLQLVKRVAETFKPNRFKVHNEEGKNIMKAYPQATGIAQTKQHECPIKYFFI